MIKVDLPLHLQVGKRKIKNLPLNLNHYRNAHFMVLNNMKIAFKESIQEQLPDLKLTEPVKISYTLFPPTNRKLDISNVLSIVDKYFCDTLVELGILEDDNYEHLVHVEFLFGSIDKHNPRAEAHISYAN